MWEGLHGEMRLRDVNARTTKRFLQWAYFQDYTVEETGALEATLQTHLELYVFGDRFNVKSLRELSLRKLQSVFEEQQSRVKRSYHTGSSLQVMRSQLTPTIPEVVNTARLAIESLPNLRDRMLQSLLGYLSWAMSWAEDLPDLIEFIQGNTDVEFALMHYPPSVVEPPWAEKGMGGQRERRLFCKCDACGRLRILARVDCGSCGKGIQADPCGWFDRTSVSQIGKAGSACSSCGKILINRCTPCKEKYLAIHQSRRIYDAINDELDDDYLYALQNDVPSDEDERYCDELADIDCDITSELDTDLWDDHPHDYDSEY
ncbi:hypothetical protein BDZ91DRAFT_97875 [Kalaharituber pfeilii]|nr:hypothetical protein BDZ91DRAFT_97875 [Kalaharituber pfeilii]